MIKYLENVRLTTLPLVLMTFLFFTLQVSAVDKNIKVYHSFYEIESLLVPSGDTTLFINIWASRCKPCLEEMPAIEEVLKLYKTKKIKFLLVSLDDPEKLNNLVFPILSKLNIEADVILLDYIKYNSWIDKVDPSWSGAIPGTLIVNSKERKFYEMSFTKEELINTIDKHLIL